QLEYLRPPELHPVRGVFFRCWKHPTSGARFGGNAMFLGVNFVNFEIWKLRQIRSNLNFENPSSRTCFKIDLAKFAKASRHINVSWYICLILRMRENGAAREN